MTVPSGDSIPTTETSSTTGTSQSGVTTLRHRTHRWFPRPLALLSFLAFIALWQFLSVVLGETATGQQIVPSIPHVARSFKTFSLHWPGGLGAGDTRTGANETYWGAVLGAAYNTGISALRAVVGFAWGVVVGVGIALVISWSRTLREMFLFPAHFARMLPLLAMIPLFGLWFGASGFGALLFIAFAVGILMFEITLNALSNVPAYYAQSASSLGASPLRIYLTVNFPAILPQLRAAILLAIPFAWSAVLASEVLANTTGLGQILNYALYYGSTDVAAITGIVVVTVASTTYLVARAILGWVTRWS
jgi:sulfonate transport system permease protein